MKRFLRHLNLVNLFLAAFLIFVLRYMSVPLFKPGVLPSAPPARKTATDAGAKPAKTEEKSPSPSDYVIIAEQNLFHPDRIIPLPVVEAPPLPKPEFVLFGTLVTDELKLAYMDDKKSGDKKNQAKKQTAVKLGDSLSGFILKEINPDSVTMVRGEEKIVVNLNDASKARGRELAGTPGGPPGSQPTNPPAAGNSQQPPMAQASEKVKPPAEREKAVNAFRDLFNRRNSGGGAGLPIQKK